MYMPILRTTDRFVQCHIHTSFYIMVMWCKEAVLETKFNLTPRANNGGTAIPVRNAAYVKTSKIYVQHITERKWHDL